jgi:hypothetical protein
MAVQVDPMKPVLKASGTTRLKLKHGELLSSFAFISNLRRYNSELIMAYYNKMVAKQRWQKAGSSLIALRAMKGGQGRDTLILSRAT